MSQKELSDYKKKVMKRGAILTAELATAGTGAGVIGKRAATKAAQKKLLAHLNRREKEITESIKKRMKAKAAAKRGKEAMASHKKRTVKKELQKHMELKRAAAKSKTKPSTTKLKRSQAKKPIDYIRKITPHESYKRAKSLAKGEGLESTIGRVTQAKVTAKGVKRPTVKAKTKVGESLRTKGPGGKTKVLTKKQREIAKKNIKADIKKKMAAKEARKTYKEGIKEAKRTGQTKRDPFKSARAKTKVKGSTKATARRESPAKSTKGQLEQPGGRRRIVDAPWNQKRIKVAKLTKQKKDKKLGPKGKKLLDKLTKKKPTKGGRKKK